MFQMVGFGGVRCPRCERSSAGQDGYCTHCGMTLGATRNEPVLHQNRWIAGPDELAVFFGVRELEGIFVKTLRVPAATRALILQGDKVTEVPQGEYEIEGFFARLNNLLRDQHAEILITRTSALPVSFECDELHTAEHLAVSLRLTISVKVELIAAFARHFMTLPGTVGSAQLRQLLAPAVRQLAAEFIGAHSLRELAANTDLRAQLDACVQGALKLELARYGLAVVQVTTLSVRHDKYDAHLARVGTLWLAVDEGHVALAHSKQLDELYSEQEWQRIAREEQEARFRQKRAELRQDEGVARAELNLAESERVHAVRARSLELYGRIVESKTRKQAIERGAGDAVTALEHDYAKKDAAREDESAEWAHLRQLAQIRMGSELEITRQNAEQARLLEQQRFSHQLLRQQIDNKIAQALSIEDEARKREQLQRLHQESAVAQQRQDELEQQRHEAARQTLALSNAARQREAERVHEWEDQVALERQRDVLRGEGLKDASARAQTEEVSQKIDAMRRAGASADALAQHEKLLRTIEADGVHARQNQQIARQGLLDQIDAEAQRQQLVQVQQEAQWQHELRKMTHEREERFARWKIEFDTLSARLAHDTELARIEITRAESLGKLSDTGKLASAAAPNAAALADYMKTQVHANMNAAQLNALSEVVGAAGALSAQDAQQLAQSRVLEERALRAADMDKDRQHQLALLTLQNEVNRVALAQQSQLGIGVAVAGAVPRTPPSPPPPRLCANGHVARVSDKFCAECGAPL